jgi:hypothetical protein
MLDPKDPDYRALEGEIIMCECIKFLTEYQAVPDKKGRYKFLDSGFIFNLQTQEEGFKPVLRGFKETPSGRLSVTGVWMPALYCPRCGEKVEAWAEHDDQIIPKDMAAAPEEVFDEWLAQ